MTEPTGAKNRIYESARHEDKQALTRILEAARPLEAQR